MQSKPILVLDIAGVLLINLSVSFWHELAYTAGTDYETMKEKLNTIRKDLWTGRMKEADFWIWLNNQYPRVNKEKAYELLQQTMKPLPATRHLKQWSEIADIHLLSNHCKEWLEPFLEEVKEYTISITISNVVGYCKPQQEIYEIVKKQIGSSEIILYVDDQEKNLIPAQLMGWRTLLADEEHKWIEEVELLLIADFERIQRRGSVV